MTDSGIDRDADVARLRLVMLCEIEWLEEIRTAHRGLLERDDALAVLEVAIEEALRRRRRRVAALAVPYG